MNDNFKDDVKRVKCGRKPKCTGAVKFIKIYNSLKKNNLIGDVGIDMFRKIIRGMGDTISQMMLDGYIITLPVQMGHMYIQQKDPKIKFVDGKVVHNMMINWNGTLDLWNSDSEAKENKKLVYFTNQKILHVKYMKSKAKFKNKYFFTVRISSGISRNMYKYSQQNNIKYHIN